MTTNQPSAALDPMVAALESAIERRVDAEWNYCLSKNVTNAMGVVPDRIVNEVAGAEAGLENIIRQLIERLVKPQYSLDADYLKAEMAKVGITEDQAANAARIVLASLTPAPPIAVPADHVTVNPEEIDVVSQLKYISCNEFNQVVESVFDQHITQWAIDPDGYQTRDFSFDLDKRLQSVLQKNAALAADQTDAG